MIVLELSEIMDYKRFSLEIAQNNIPLNSNWDLLGEAKKIYSWLIDEVPANKTPQVIENQ